MSENGNTRSRKKTSLPPGFKVIAKRDPEDPIPAAFMLATGVAGAIGFGSIIASLIGDPMSAGINAAKWELTKHIGGLDAIMQTYDTVTDAHPDGRSGLDITQLENLFDRIITQTIWLKAQVPAEISSRIYMSMLDWSLSQAMQTSLGGAVQSSYNTYRGAANPLPNTLQTLFPDREMVDEKLHALVNAESGANLPFSFMQMMRGAKQRMEEKLRLADQFILEQIRERNDTELRVLREVEEMAFSYIREQFIAVAAVLRAAYQTAIRTCSYYITRVQEQYDLLESGRTYFENGTWDVDRFKLVISEIETQVGVEEANYGPRVTDLVTAAEEVVDEMTFDTDPIDTIRGHRTDIIKKGLVKYHELLDVLRTDEQLVLEDQFSKLRAYRYLVAEGTPPDEPIATLETWSSPPPIITEGTFSIQEVFSIGRVSKSKTIYSQVSL